MSSDSSTFSCDIARAVSGGRRRSEAVRRERGDRQVQT
jgi:hypothetical protein